MKLVSHIEGSICAESVVHYGAEKYIWSARDDVTGEWYDTWCQTKKCTALKLRRIKKSRAYDVYEEEHECIRRLVGKT